MGEKKLKGLENPELVYSLYPHALVGRIDQHTAHERAQDTSHLRNKPAQLSPGSELSFDPEIIWALWRDSLRLEMLCSTLEDSGGRGLQPPETELLERMRQRGGEVTETFMMKFMEHQISRIEVGYDFLFCVILIKTATNNLCFYSPASPRSRSVIWR